MVIGIIPGMARQAIPPNAENCSLAELEKAMRCTPKRTAFIRMQAIRALLLGFTHDQVADIVKKSRRTISRWVRHFNESGIDGLIDKPRSGCPRKISPAQSAKYQELIENPRQAGQDHWTAKKFHGYIREEFDHEVGYRTVTRWLDRSGFRLKVPQPWPDRQNESEREAFLEKLREWLADHNIDIWYLDETGIEGDPRPRRRWIQQGEKGRVAKNGDHIRMNVTGMICPRTGEFYALEFTHSDSETFQAFLDRANADIELERPRNLLICDNASWHKRKKTVWGAFEPVHLPAYSPDLNPIERLWLVLKAEWFCDFVAKNREELIERLDQALMWLINRQEENTRTCSIKTKL